MSIASDLEKSIIKMRCLLQRGNDEIVRRGPDILGEMDEALERVRGLETVAPISAELAEAFQEKGERHV